LAEGRDVLLDIDVQGAAQIVSRYPNSITIFIMPPSLEVLRQRLAARGTDSPATIAKRLDNARTEMPRQGNYRHVIVNDVLSDAVAELLSIVAGYRSNPTDGESS
jgi:guanylate kinase